MTQPDTRTIEEFRAEMQAATEDMVELLATKRLAYGTDNLTRFGSMGILIRMSDKFDRLLHRYRDGLDSVGGMDADTVEDTWMDLVGYALLGLDQHRRSIAEGDGDAG
jgi:hypothetical protein